MKQSNASRVFHLDGRPETSRNTRKRVSFDTLHLLVFSSIIFLTRASYASLEHASPAGDPPLLIGQAALGDWTTDAPGVRRRILPGDLPLPYASSSVDRGAHIVPQPQGAWPKVPSGFQVDMTFYTGHQFPQEYVNDGFAAEHGSWNRLR